VARAYEELKLERAAAYREKLAEAFRGLR